MTTTATTSTAGARHLEHEEQGRPRPRHRLRDHQHPERARPDARRGGRAADGDPLVVCTVLSVIALVAGVVAWRSGSRPAARLTAGSLVVVTLTSLPAFFVDVPAGIKILVAAGVVITIAFVVLIFSPAKRG